MPSTPPPFRSIPLDQSILPTQGIAERYDIVVDFGAANGLKDGDILYFVNTLEHITGKVTGNKIPLATILSGAYNPVQAVVGGVPVDRRRPVRRKVHGISRQGLHGHRPAA